MLPTTHVEVQAVQAVSNHPAPLVLRAEPTKLENPDNRCVRNALLQAFMPIMLEVMNLHAQRTGVLLDDQAWIQLIQNTPTAGDLLAIGLGRTVLALNAFQGSVGTTLFNNLILASHYAADSCGITLLVRELVAGINAVTAARIVFYQLPVDRELIPSFNVERYLANQFTHDGQNPDYLVLDTGGISLRTLDQHSIVKSGGFTGAHEQSLPIQITITDAHGAQSSYELCSFISFERSGIPSTSSVWSRLSSLLQHFATQNVANLHILPMRHAVATVHYGSNWFIADDGCIWKVADGISAQTLVEQQPGYRAVMIYKKVPAHLAHPAHIDATAPLSCTSDLVLHKIDGPEGISYAEQPSYPLLWALTLLFSSITGIAVGIFAWQGITLWSNSTLKVIAYTCLVLSFASLFVLCTGGIAHYASLALRARKRLQKQIVFAAGSGHKSGLYE